MYYSQKQHQRRHHRHQHQQQQAASETRAGDESRKLSWKKEIRAAKCFGVLLVVFAACWLPLHVMNAVSLFGDRTNLTVVKVAVILSHANSAVNPLLYAYSNSAFVAAFRMVCLPQRHVAPSSTGADAGTSSVNA